MQVGEYWLKKYSWKSSGEKALNNMGNHFKVDVFRGYYLYLSLF